MGLLLHLLVLLLLPELIPTLPIVPQLSSSRFNKEQHINFDPVAPPPLDPSLTFDPEDPLKTPKPYSDRFSEPLRSEPAGVENREEWLRSTLDWWYKYVGGSSNNSEPLPEWALVKCNETQSSPRGLANRSEFVGLGCRVGEIIDKQILGKWETKSVLGTRDAHTDLKNTPSSASTSK